MTNVRITPKAPGKPYGQKHHNTITVNGRCTLVAIMRTLPDGSEVETRYYEHPTAASISRLERLLPFLQHGNHRVGYHRSWHHSYGMHNLNPMFEWDYVPDLDDLVAKWAPGGVGVSFDLDAVGRVCALVVFDAETGKLPEMPTSIRKKIADNLQAKLAGPPGGI